MADEGIDLSEVRENAEAVTAEDLQALMNDSARVAPPQVQREAHPELEKACAGGLRVNAVPAVIELEDGREFIADDFRAWGYCPYGVFAIGRFADAAEDVEEYRVFNGDKVSNILLQWEAYEEAAEAQKKAEESEEDTSGDESDAAESSSD